MFVTLAEAKEYLKVEYDDEDTLIESLIQSAEDLCTDILRKEVTEYETVRVAVLFAVSYLYDSRGNTDMDELIRMLKAILSSKREVEF